MIYINQSQLASIIAEGSLMRKVSEFQEDTNSVLS